MDGTFQKHKLCRISLFFTWGSVNDKPDTDFSVIWADNSSANFWVEHNMYCHLPPSMLAACFTACYQTVTLPKYIHVIVKACATEHRPDMAEAMKYECLWYTDDSLERRKKKYLSIVGTLSANGEIRTELLSIPSDSSWGDGMFKNQKLTN